jgi:hypothetical protein
MSLVMSLMLIMSSCSKANTSPKVGEDGLINIDMFTHNSHINYQKLPDINAKKIKEIKLERKVEGGIITVSQLKEEFIIGDMSSNPFKPGEEPVLAWPVVTKLDIKGGLLWRREYPIKNHTGMISNLNAYTDGSFVFTMQSRAYYKDNDRLYEKSYVVKCDSDGNILWKQEFDDYSGEMLRYLFITGSGDIIVVGQCPYVDGKQVTEGYANIVITKLDKDGKVKEQRSFGGSDFDMLYEAQFDRDLGIVISGNTQSSDGDFAFSKDGFGVGFVACIDEELNLRWKHAGSKRENIGYTPFVISKGFVYKTGYIQYIGETPSEGILMKLDNSGNRLWTKTDTPDYWHARTMAALDNGTIIISSGNYNEGKLIIIDEDGREIKRLDKLPFTAEQIVPTEDGGFIVTATRIIKTVPQPLIISSIWYDVEVVAAKFNKNYSVDWRKTYDKYKNTTTRDFIEPLRDGRLIVEK